MLFGVSRNLHKIQMDKILPEDTGCLVSYQFVLLHAAFWLCLNLYQHAHIENIKTVANLSNNKDFFMCILCFHARAGYLHHYRTLLKEINAYKHLWKRCQCSKANRQNTTGNFVWSSQNDTDRKCFPFFHCNSACHRMERVGFDLDPKNWHTGWTCAKALFERSDYKKENQLTFYSQRRNRIHLESVIINDTYKVAAKIKGMCIRLYNFFCNEYNNILGTMFKIDFM